MHDEDTLSDQTNFHVHIFNITYFVKKIRNGLYNFFEITLFRYFF